MQTAGKRDTHVSGSPLSFISAVARPIDCATASIGAPPKMPGIRDTAYPELKSSLSARELAEVYTPNFVELVWAEKRTREPAPRVGLLALLKIFQRLGYFVSLSDVPASLLEHIARSAGYDSVPSGIFRYDAGSE